MESVDYAIRGWIGADEPPADFIQKGVGLGISKYQTLLFVELVEFVGFSEELFVGGGEMERSGSLVCGAKRAYTRQEDRYYYRKARHLW
jgi:hypothetical protein